MSDPPEMDSGYRKEQSSITARRNLRGMMVRAIIAAAVLWGGCVLWIKSGRVYTDAGKTGALQDEISWLEAAQQTMLIPVATLSVAFAALFFLKKQQQRRREREVENGASGKDSR